MFTRRSVLSGAGSLLALAGTGSLSPGRSAAAASLELGPPTLPAGTLTGSMLEALPGKKPLIKKSFRPPNYETPVSVFSEAITPNDQFFVRWHLADIPEVDAKTWKLRIGGDGADKPLELSFDALTSEFEQVEITAVCQCSGNRRGLSNPHVTGVQWGLGAMGNARWKGPRLKDILTKAGVKPESVEVALNGADKGVVEKTPDFIKSIPLWKAMDENTIIALQMNGEPLPHWNGFPARLIVAGWTATYWVKQLTEIEILTKPEGGFWMSAAYRVPLGKFPLVDRFMTQESGTNTPITEMVVNSLITNLTDGERLRVRRFAQAKGIAWDGGFGIARVEVSLNGGHSWREAALGEDMGRFSWRQWSFDFRPRRRGTLAIMARATNTRGATQTSELIFNPAGYHNNVIQRIDVQIV